MHVGHSSTHNYKAISNAEYALSYCIPPFLAAIVIWVLLHRDTSYAEPSLCGTTIDCVKTMCRCS